MTGLRTKLFTLLGLTLTSSLVIAGVALAQGPGFKAHSLLDATPIVIAQRAMDFTRANYKVVSGTAEVVLNRTVTVNQFPSLGLAEMSFPYEDPPLRLVVLHGDFDLTDARGTKGRDPSTWNSRVTYIAYVFDLRADAPTLMMTSKRGGVFRQLLNNPGLPN